MYPSTSSRDSQGAVITAGLGSVEMLAQLNCMLSTRYVQPITKLVFAKMFTIALASYAVQ